MRVDRRALHTALKELARLAPTRGPLPHLSNVLLAGADAFLLKGCPTSELLEAVMPAAH